MKKTKFKIDDYAFLKKNPVIVGVISEIRIVSTKDNPIFSNEYRLLLYSKSLEWFKEDELHKLLPKKDK